MSRRYKVREIAQQAGLSEATVDRVLHNRANVRESTRLEVAQAIRDLDKQRSQLRLAGRKYLIDVVMQAPQRFSSAFRAAVEAELPALAPAVVRSRFHFRETGLGAGDGGDPGQDQSPRLARGDREGARHRPGGRGD